jgi:hypothetical protein
MVWWDEAAMVGLGPEGLDGMDDKVGQVWFVG